MHQKEIKQEHLEADNAIKRPVGNPQLQKGGTSLNPKGRPKGSSNKTTTEMREFLREWLDNEGWPTLFQRFPNMNDRLVKETVEMVGKFLLPTLSATKLEADITSNQPMIVEIVYKHNDKPNDSIEEAEIID